MRQKRILLRFIETVDFIDEDDGPRAVDAGALGIGHDLFDFFDSDQHCGELDELRFGQARDNLRQRGLTRARRAPENQRADVVALDLRTQRLAGAD